MFSRANLTPAAWKQIDAAIDALAKGQKSLVDWSAYQKLSEKVNALLTQEQKEAMKKPWAPAGAAAWTATSGTAPGQPSRELGQRGVRIGEYWLGLEVGPLQEELRKKLNLPQAQGLVVLQVAPESPAAKGGLKREDVLLKAGCKPLKNIQDLIDAIQEAKNKDLAIELNRNGKAEKLAVRPAKRAAGGLQCGGAGGQVFVLREGGNPLAVALPDGVTVTITKTGKKPAKIKVRQEKTWEVGPTELGKLPEDLRPYVEQMLGGGPIRIEVKEGAKPAACPDAK